MHVKYFILISDLEIPPPKKRKTCDGILEDIIYVAEMDVPKTGADGSDCRIKTVYQNNLCIIMKRH